jgi:AcrR family transcriptional regulator
MSNSPNETDWQSTPISGSVPSGMASKATPEGSEPFRGARSFDLRERKRTRTRLMIQAEALRLFGEKGYEQTTVEEIADAAAISPRTFFRYFPAKEDVVIWDEYDPLVVDLLESRPKEEPPAETFRAVIRESLSGLYRRDPERLLARVRLAVTVPEIRARLLDEQTHGVEVLAPLLATKRGAPVDERKLRVVGSALLAAVFVALDLWQKDGEKSDLLALIDDATDALVEGLRELQSPVR